MTTLSSLIFALDDVTVIGTPAARTTAICQDSRDLPAGGTFVAVPGDRVDGHSYLPQAIARGANVLVVQQDHHPQWEPLRDCGVTLLCVPDTRAALGRLAAAYYDYPSRHLDVVGVTGTDGKTTTIFLTAAVLAAGGVPTAFLSTAGVGVGGQVTPNDTHLTTPDAVAVQRFLARARATGASCAILEASSQGLHQGRLAEVEVDVAVLTNLTGDHLDYHRSPEAYLLAKARLYQRLDTSRAKRLAKTAVLNVDSPAAAALAAHTRARQIGYGMTTAAGDVTADRVACRGWHTSFRLRATDRVAGVRFALPGRFNVYNSLAAASVGVAFGLDVAQIGRGLESVTGVPGRMQRIVAGQDFSVVVDYAHNPHGLRQVLAFLRQATPGRVIVVFGCAGDRDPSRRPGMGRVAAQLADYTIVTSEDSWDEDPEAIAAEVVRGLVEAGGQAGRDFVLALDRREAIGLALNAAGPGDTVLVAGMGHERSMVVAGEAYPWDDREVVRELLTGRDPARL